MSSNDDTGRTEAMATFKRGIDQRVSAIEEAMATKEDLARLQTSLQDTLEDYKQYTAQSMDDFKQTVAQTIEEALARFAGQHSALRSESEFDEGCTHTRL